MLLFNARKNSQGFTLIETLIIVVIIGILSAIAVPSFLALLDRSKVNSALSQVQGVLQQAQREAIRKSKPCTVTLAPATKQVTANCSVTSDRTLNSSIGMETNETSIQFSYRGTITLSDAGTVVFFTESNPTKKKCLVISKPLGIIRTGNYTGQIPSDVANPISKDNCAK
jgi:prepilin-type N-terminal cleavage/methylation domain-containing protein